MTLVKITEMSKSFGENLLYKEATLSIKQGEIIGILGENGAGKTTLLKIITGAEQISSGEISFHHEISISALNQVTPIDPNRQVKDLLAIPFQKNMALEQQLEELSKELSAVSSEQMEPLLEQYAAVWEEFNELGNYDYRQIQEDFIRVFHLDDHLEKRYSMLSGGEKQYIKLSLALFSPEKLVLLDEPTAHLDDYKMTWLKKYINESSKTFLIVSHNIDFTASLSTAIFDISHQKITPYYCDYKAYLIKKASYLERITQLNSTSDTIIEKKLGTIEKKRKWMRKAEHKKPHAIVIKRLMRDMDKLKREQTALQLEKSYFFPQANSESIKTEKAIELIGVAKKFESQCLFENLSLSLYNKSKISIYGKNGSGKTTLLHMISGKESLTQGRIIIDPRLKIALISQELPGDFQEETVVSYLMRMASVGVLLAEETIGNLFEGQININNRFSLLSGGEQKRLQIAAAILEGADFLLVDEPTTFMDDYSVTLIVKMLENFQGGLVVISHDTTFLAQLNIRKYKIENRNLVRIL